MSLPNVVLSHVQAIPGLYISEQNSRFAARSRSLLAEYNITHILSATRLEDLPFNPSSTDFHIKHVDLDDDPTEDLLAHLDEICDWIADALRSQTRRTPRRILVHCNQGVSRSGSIIIAYLMRTLSLSYTEALSVAREARFQIAPNVGFEYQLRIWEKCGYSSFMRDDGAGVVPEQEYEYWKKEVEGIYRRHVDEIPRARADWLASLTAKMNLLGST